MSANDLLTLTEAKKILSLSGTSAYDAELPMWISAVSQRMDDLIGPIVQRTVSSEKHNGGYHTVYLRYYPVYTITTVTEYNFVTPITLSPESNTSKPYDAYVLDSYEPDPTLGSQRLRRRYSGVQGTFIPGNNNVVVTYVAGRVGNTASVSEKAKLAAGMMLRTAWRSQEVGTARVGEFDVPTSNFPTFAVPKFVREMFSSELQDPKVYIA